jgi:hypothetical protein
MNYTREVAAFDSAAFDSAQAAGGGWWFRLRSTTVQLKPPQENIPYNIRPQGAAPYHATISLCSLWFCLSA